MQDIQFDWDGAAWQQSEVGAEPGKFSLGVMDEFAYIIATGSEGDEEFFTLGSNPGLAFGDPEWLFAQDNPGYVAECLGLPSDRVPAVTKVVDKYLSRLDDEKTRGKPRVIVDELVDSMGLPAVSW